MKKKIRNTLVASLLFVLTIALVLGAGSYKNMVSAEKAQFQATIPGKNNTPVVLDIAKQSLPKKLVQPGVVSISTGHGPMGIRNVGNKDLLVQVKLKGFPGKVELELPEMEYDKNTFALKNPIKSKQLFKMDLIVEIPKKYREKLVGFSAEIQFLNQKDHSLISSIPVHVVNSKYGDPYKKLNIEKPSFTPGSWGGNGNGKGGWSKKGQVDGKETEKVEDQATKKNTGITNEKGSGEGTEKSDSSNTNSTPSNEMCH